MVAGVQEIMSDSTEERKIADMKDRFISAVTAELLTPLTSIEGYLDLILSGRVGSVPGGLESSLRIVKRNTDRLVRLTDELLDIQRLETGSFQLNLMPLDLRDIIDECAIEILPFINEKKQSLSLDIPEADFLITGDYLRLSRVVTNLLDNAFKFTPEGGAITVRARNEGDRIEVAVSDTGIGVKREDLERVFEPFAAIEKTTYVKGAGLGLSVSKQIIEAHGGKIWVHSDGEGKQSTFVFTLPKQKEAKLGQLASGQDSGSGQ